METAELLAPDPPYRSEVHYLRLGRLLMISAVIFMLLFAGTSAAILWRIQDQAEQRAQVMAQGMVELAWQWLVDRLAVLGAVDRADAPPHQLVGTDKSWYALRVVSDNGNTVTHFGASDDLPATIDLPANPNALTSLAPLKLGNRNNWVVPIVSPVSAQGMRVVGFLNQSAFEQLFRTIHPDGKGSLCLFSAEGILLLRHPFPERLIGRDFSSGPLFSERLKEQVTGTSWAPKSTDGVLRLVAHHSGTATPSS